jgi:hypothetical protein
VGTFPNSSASDGHFLGLAGEASFFFSGAFYSSSFGQLYLRLRCMFLLLVWFRPSTNLPSDLGSRELLT